MGRAILGLLACALVFGAGYAVVDAVAALWAAADPAAALSVRKAVNAFLGATLLSATTLAILGRAAFLILARFNRWPHAVIGGLALAFTMNFGIALALLVARTFEGPVLDQVPGLLPEAIKVAAVGALAGYVYWAIARPDRAATGP
ncbi:MAG: hypothetical protein SFV21_15275 [Rhodospirillaceae bacterium]|nr:hypothetical protein [Rhodospirillaceae bacterium]